MEISKFANYSFDDCEKNIEQGVALPDDYINDIELYREAFNLGCMLNHPVYDMLYLILARRNNAKFLTMDKKLISAAQKCNVKT
ncbi:MAG: type II toxin-antitoxin system VapC family toxin [Pseudomonadota bacterium]